jgi:hypothetical protein
MAWVPVSVLILHDPGDAEIAQVRFVLGIEEDIGGFEIAMKDAAIVSVLNGASDFDDEASGRFRFYGLTGQFFVQRRSGNQAHAEKGLTIVLTDFVNGHDVWMIEAGRHLGFGLEAAQRIIAGESNAVD